LLCNLWCKSNVISIISYFMACLPQLGSVTYAVVAGGCDWPLPPAVGPSNNDVVALRSLRFVRCVGWKPRLTTFCRFSLVIMTRCPVFIIAPVADIEAAVRRSVDAIDRTGSGLENLMTMNCDDDDNLILSGQMIYTR